MRVVLLTAVMRTETNGFKQWAGWVEDGVSVPDGVLAMPLSALDPEDGTNTRWLLAQAEAVTSFDAGALATFCEDECRRAGIANLSDEDLASLGLSRK